MKVAPEMSFRKGPIVLCYLTAGLASTIREQTVPECMPAASAGALTLAAGTAVADALTGDRVAGAAAVELAGSVGLAGTTGAAATAGLGGTVALRGGAAAGFAAGPAQGIAHRLREPGSLCACKIQSRPIGYTIGDCVEGTVCVG